MDRDKAIQKIRKCLALGKSSNAHEAAAALRQAQALMREHGLDSVDVELSDVHEVPQLARMQTLTAWETALVNLVAGAFTCEVIAGRRLMPGVLFRVRREWVFIGVGAAPELAGYAYDVLSRQCAKARLAHIQAQPKSCKPITRTARGDAFAAAWVRGVETVVHAAAGSERHQELLLTYLKRMYPDLTTAKPKNRAVGRNVRDDSLVAGYRAGKQAELNRAVGGAQKQELLA